MFWEMLTALGTIASVVIVVVMAIRAGAKRNHKLESDRILKEAEEKIALAELKLNARIDTAEASLENLRGNVERDLNLIKEGYRGEVKILASKIEDLRDQLRQQHMQLLGLLSDLIKK